MQPPASGRHLLQSGSNADNITSNLGVNTAQNVRVNLTVSVPFEDRNNVTAIVQSAINSGQVARGLLEAGKPPATRPRFLPLQGRGRGSEIGRMVSVFQGQGLNPDCRSRIQRVLLAKKVTQMQKDASWLSTTLSEPTRFRCL